MSSDVKDRKWLDQLALEFTNRMVEFNIRKISLGQFKTALWAGDEALQLDALEEIINQLQKTRAELKLLLEFAGDIHFMIDTFESEVENV